MPEAASGSWRRSREEKSPAASMMGIEMRKEKRAAAGLCKSRIIPPAIVDPERERPGKIDAA
jgi:hypothetical protein